MPTNRLLCHGLIFRQWGTNSKCDADRTCITNDLGSQVLGRTTKCVRLS